MVNHNRHTNSAGCLYVQLERLACKHLQVFRWKVTIQLGASTLNRNPDLWYVLQATEYLLVYTLPTNLAKCLFLLVNTVKIISWWLLHNKTGFVSQILNCAPLLIGQVYIGQDMEFYGSKHFLMFDVLLMQYKCTNCSTVIIGLKNGLITSGGE